MPGKPLTELPLPGGQRLSATEAAGELALRLDDQPLLRVAVQGLGAARVFEPLDLVGEQAGAQLEALAYWCFASEPTRLQVQLSLGQVPAAVLASGLLVDDGQGLRIERGAFWQLSGACLRVPGSAGYPQTQVMHASGRRHPRRPPKPRGEVYRRFDARLGAWVSLRCLEVEQDLERFSRWQNQPRVAHFWQEQGDLAQHRRYLESLAADPRVLTLIGCLDDEPFAYFEAYWAKEDRIAPFYAAGDYDRGIHLLVGEEHHRGPHKVAAWLGALVHYLFLDEPRTQTLVLEPRADNLKMIGYLQSLGFFKEKEFDFPHKRAALMALRREAFFERCPLA
ncbi:MAG: GNAT family N-acetyltransferase [Pseudomonas sp.]|uniref:GNAT family N-acetyltransferase n=1 Tax=Pseudomonas sp. TaxID=306 RepID=UPI0033967691